MNDQQWVMQRKKIGLSRRNKKVLQNKLAAEQQKMSAITYIQTHFNRKECTKFIDDGTVLDKCLCGLTKSKHKTWKELESENEELFGTKFSNNYDMDKISEVSENDNTDHHDGSIADSLADLLHSPDANGYQRNKGQALKKTRVVARSVLALGDRNGSGNYHKSDVDGNNTVKHIQEFSTNAYGQIEFEGMQASKLAKYLRLADNTTLASVKEFVCDYWNLMKPRPHLALSVVGGAKNFKLDGRKKETFKRGLIAAAQATNAWMLSGGTNAGCMKLIGETVKEGQFLVSDGSKMRRGLKAIGLCSWGYISNAESLVNKTSSEFNKVVYNSNAEIKKHVKPPLDPNHTHFLMVDNGRDFQHFDVKMGGVTQFITEFERMVREPEPRGLGIPIITLLLEGGTDAIFKVKDSLEQGQPCVIIEGSGRAADILAYGYRHATRQTSGVWALKEGHIKHLEVMLEEAYSSRLQGQRGEENRKMFMNWIIDVVGYSDMITVFNIKREEDMDKKILFALLKSEKFNFQSQMFLSMVWNRVDIAEEKIFCDRNLEWEQGDFDEVMTKALLMERVEFVELLILNGVSFRQFLTVARLRELYNESSFRHPGLMDQLEHYTDHRGYIYLRNIHFFLCTIMKSHKSNLYQLDRPSMGKAIEKQISSNAEQTFDEPYFELFIWSVLSNKANLAEFFWLKTRHPLIAAVFASTFYGMLYNDMYKLRSWDRLRALKKEYSDRANSIMELAYVKDWDKATSLLDRRFERFGNRSLLNIAYTGHLKTFIANTPCHDAVRSIWQRGFTKFSSWVAVLAIFCPLLILTPVFKFFPLGDDGGDLTSWQKIYVFYRAPIVKYIGSFISYAAFLVLYTSVALFNFEWQYRAPEILVYVWLLILMIEESREIYLQPAKRAKAKIRDHLSSVWNKLDFLIYLIAIVGFILKHMPGTFQVSRAMFAINAALLYSRLFRVYHASLKLGPKLVIFHRMIPEIVTFMLLLIIFILGYGTASQALLNPKEKFQVSHVPDFISDIIFLPYWQMYGELNLESVVTVNKTVCYEDAFCEDFTLYNNVTLILLAIYLLIGNVMLLNLLIAIFTAVFEDVQENSKDVWKYEMYRLVEEYDERPGTAPPLVIFELIYRVIKKIWKETCRGEKENLELLISGMLETLDLFEKDSLNSYVVQKARDEQGKMENKVANIESKLRDLEEHFEESPTNVINDWGDDIATDKKLYLSDDEDDSNDLKTIKQKQRKVSRHVIFQENVDELQQNIPSPKNKVAKKVVAENVMDKLEIMEEKFRSLDDRTSSALSQMETILQSIQSSLQSRVSQPRQ